MGGRSKCGRGNHGQVVTARKRQHTSCCSQGLWPWLPSSAPAEMVAAMAMGRVCGDGNYEARW